MDQWIDIGRAQLRLPDFVTKHGPTSRAHHALTALKLIIPKPVATRLDHQLITLLDGPLGGVFATNI